MNSANDMYKYFELQAQTQELTNRVTLLEQALKFYANEPPTDSEKVQWNRLQDEPKLNFNLVEDEEPGKEWTLEEILAVPVRERLKLVPKKRVRHDMKGSWVMRYADSCCILPYEMEYGKNGRAHLDQTCAWQGYISEDCRDERHNFVTAMNGEE